MRDELAEVWTRVLSVRPGPDDTFTDLGGSSVQVEEAIAHSRGHLIAPLVTADFTGDPTLDEQAGRVARRYRAGFGAGDTALQQLRPGAAPAVFCFAGAGATAAWYLPLVAALAAAPGTARGVYGLQAHGLQSRARAAWSVTGAARRHRRAITGVQPAGPYVLVGHSFGGIVALATAEALRRRGHRIAQVVLLDTVVDSDLALARWAPEQEGFSGATAGSRLPRPLRLLGDRARAAGAGLVRYDPVRQKELFWALGMRAQRRYRIGDCAQVSVLLTADAPGQAALWQELGVPETRIHQVPGGHLSMAAEPAVADRLASIVTAALRGEY